MSKQKVRPMVDKELRDEVINYCGGGESFNSALRYYAKGKSRAEHFANIFTSKAKTQEAAIHSLHGQVKYRDRKIIELKQDIANLHNEKVNLEKWSSGVEQQNASLMDEICGDRWRYTERVKFALCYGASIGLIAGIAIGHLFL